MTGSVSRHGQRRFENAWQTHRSGKPAALARAAVSNHECQKKTPQKGMPDVAPHRLHISRHYGFPLYRTPRTEDGRRVPAGLLACGSNALLRPSQRTRTWGRQWHLRRNARRSQLRGQPRLLARKPYRVPFFTRSILASAAGTVTRTRGTQKMPKVNPQTACANFLNSKAVRFRHRTHPEAPTASQTQKS